MDINRRKEEFGMAFVHAIASVAGYSLVRPTVDDDSIDLQFLSNTSNAYTRSPRFEAQLKCTAQEEMLHDDTIHLPIKIKNYNDLRDAQVLVPRMLICVLLPADDPSSWILHSEEMLSMMKCGYWVNLRGYPPKETNTHTVTVQIPKHQIFNASALSELMETVGRTRQYDYAK